MAVIRRLSLTVAAVALIVAGCTSITLPSLPPIQLPTGLALPTADANSGTCLLITPAEVSAIMGETFTATVNQGSVCTYGSGAKGIVISVEPDPDLSGPRTLFGSSAEDITVGGFPAVRGSVVQQPGVYVQKGDQQLSVQGLLLANDQTTLDNLVEVANTIVGRMQ